MRAEHGQPLSKLFQLDFYDAVTRALTSRARIMCHARREFFFFPSPKLQRFSQFQVYLNVTQAKQMISLLLLDNFYPSCRRVQVDSKRKRRITVHMARSLVMVRESVCQGRRVKRLLDEQQAFHRRIISLFCKCKDTFVLVHRCSNSVKSGLRFKQDTHPIRGRGSRNIVSPQAVLVRDNRHHGIRQTRSSYVPKAEASRFSAEA